MVKNNAGVKNLLPQTLSKSALGFNLIISNRLALVYQALHTLCDKHQHISITHQSRFIA
ncbi:MAG: hypothetical protein Rpha_1387 [Candidatus Ruthia sp. Apha_13_S6]|nr:hypothetical protein [Candidatus Ruthia sp. Apha_13_S6]